jgi:hypothetical protein
LLCFLTKLRRARVFVCGAAGVDALVAPSTKSIV